MPPGIRFSNSSFALLLFARTEVLGGCSLRSTLRKTADTSGNGRWRGRSKTFFKLALTATLLAILVRLVGWRELVAALGQTRWDWLLSMYSAALVTFCIMAFNLFLLAGKLGVPISYSRVLQANALSNFYSLILPGDLMAGLSKWAILSAATRDTAGALSAIVLNKLALAIPPVFLGFVALALENPFDELRAPELAGLCAALIAVGLGVTLWPPTGAFIDRSLLTVADKLPERVGKGLRSLALSIERFRGFRPRDHLQVIVVAFLAFSTGLAAFFSATRALDLEVPIVTLVWISMALFVARLLPLTFNNLGVREGLLMLALAGHDISSARAMAVGLVMFSSSVLIALLGGLCQLSIALGWMNWQVRPGSES